MRGFLFEDKESMMKKTIITVCAIGLAAAAAQAQGVARDVNEFGKEYLRAKQIRPAAASSKNTPKVTSQTGNPSPAARPENRNRYHVPAVGVMKDAAIFANMYAPQQNASAPSRTQSDSVSRRVQSKREKAQTDSLETAVLRQAAKHARANTQPSAAEQGAERADSTQIAEAARKKAQKKERKESWWSMVLEASRWPASQPFK